MRKEKLLLYETKKLLLKFFRLKILSEAFNFFFIIVLGYLQHENI